MQKGMAKRKAKFTTHAIRILSLMDFCFFCDISIAMIIALIEAIALMISMC
jgi:hypothetical protein